MSGNQFLSVEDYSPIVAPLDSAHGNNRHNRRYYKYHEAWQYRDRKDAERAAAIGAKKLAGRTVILVGGEEYRVADWPKARYRGGSFAACTHADGPCGSIWLNVHFAVSFAD